MKKALGFNGVVLVLLILIMTACENKNIAPDIDTDNNLRWDAGDNVKRSMVDTELYQLTIEIGRDVASAGYQTAPAQGQGYIYGNDGSVYGRSTYVGPTETRKGLTLGKVLQSSHPDIIEEGAVVMMKFSDLKASILQGGDIVEVVCRRDFEALSPVLDKQTWQEAARTWELDVCRISNPYIHTAE